MGERDQPQLRVLLWDVRVGGTRRLPLIERADADLALLLGVSDASSRAWTTRWEGRYHCAAGLHLTGSPQQRPHGAMIASRWPITDMKVINELPKPERGLIATIAHPGGPVSAVSWGAPNAAGESREDKMRAYAHMGTMLAAFPAPVIVGIDTNSWFDPPHGSVPPADPDWAPEHHFLSPDADHGLVDVYRALIDGDRARRQLLADLRPDGPLATTLIRRPHRQPRQIAGDVNAGLSWGLDRMDRIFVSPDVAPLACETLYHEAIDAGGDHAAVIADLVPDDRLNLNPPFFLARRAGEGLDGLDGARGGSARRLRPSVGPLGRWFGV